MAMDFSSPNQVRGRLFLVPMIQMRGGGVHLARHEIGVWNKIKIVSLHFVNYTVMSLLKRVEDALDSIRPYLEADGGNVSVAEITADNVVRLKLLGSCASGAMSIMTFKAGLEQAIKKAVPEITAVEAINLTDMDDPNATMPITRTH